MYDFNYFQFMDGDWCLEFKKTSDTGYIKPTYQKLFSNKKAILQFIVDNTMASVTN